MSKERKEFEKELRTWRTIYHTLNEAIKASRIREQYTTLEMSRLVGVSEEEYIKVENGEKAVTKEFLKPLLKPLSISKKCLSLVDPERPEYAKRIIELRMKEGRTQEETSKILGIAPTTYAGYETGRREPDIETLIKIATLYNVALDYVVGRY